MPSKYSKIFFEKRICVNCSNSYHPKQRHQKYCSKECTQKYFSLNIRKNPLKLPTGTIGTIAELSVGCDLLEKGYDVFKALSSHCSFDLVIHKNGILNKIEVRTGYRYSSSPEKITYNKKGNYDIMAVFIRGTNEIYYFKNKEQIYL